MEQSGLWPMLYAIGKQLLAFHRIRICMYIMRRVGAGLPSPPNLSTTVKFTLRLIGRCLERSVSPHTPTLSSFLFLPRPHEALHFDADAKKTTVRGYFDKRNAGGFSNVHTAADSCYFWELGDVFVRPVRGLTVHCLDTFGVYFTTRTRVGKMSFNFFFFIYIFRSKIGILWLI